MNHSNTQHIIGLDIGTGSIRAVYGGLNSEEGLTVWKYFRKPTRGLRLGDIVDEEKLQSSLEEVFNELSLEERSAIESIYCCLPVSKVNMTETHETSILKGNVEISTQEIQRLHHLGMIKSIPRNAIPLHIIPVEYCIDGDTFVSDPAGRKGSQLEVEMQVLYTDDDYAYQVSRLLQRIGFRDIYFLMDILSDAEFLIPSHCRQESATVINIGVESSKYALYREGRLVNFGYIYIGSKHITNDIAFSFQISKNDAENLKLNYGRVHYLTDDYQNMLQVKTVGRGEIRQFSMDIMVEIISCRVEDIFLNIHKQMTDAGYDPTRSEVFVITGGSSNTEGIFQLGQEFFNCTCESGYFPAIGGDIEDIMKPEWITAIGALYYGYHNGGLRIAQKTLSERRGRLTYWLQHKFGF